MKKYLRFLVTIEDLFNIVIIIIALFLSLVGTSTIFDGNTDLNSRLPIFLYTTLATVVSSILDPILELVKVEARMKKMIVILLGILASLVTFCYSFYDNSIFAKLQSISKRGGFSAISVALLLFNLIYINYQLQKIREEELNEDKRKQIEDKRKQIEDKRKYKATLEENIELKKRVSKLEGRTNE